MIGERYRLNHAIDKNFTTPYSIFPVKFAYLIGESRLFRRIVTFLTIAPYKYSYLLTYLSVSCW